LLGCSTAKKVLAFWKRQDWYGQSIALTALPNNTANGVCGGGATEWFFISQTHAAIKKTAKFGRLN
jgi:hypothetical protein